MSLFRRVVDLERKDGEPVDDQAGRLGVERGVFVLRSGLVEQDQVNLLHEVVALLIQAVDRVLHVGDGRIWSVGRAGRILLVPEVEVGLMLAHDEPEEIVAGGHSGVHVPLRRGGVLEVSDFSCAKHDPRQTLTVSAAEF